MKKVFLILTILFMILSINSCEDAFNTEPKEENYYLSVRIVDISTNETIPLSGNLVGIYVNGKLAHSRTIGNNGWLTYGVSLEKSDFVKLYINSKDFSQGVMTQEFTPSNSPGLFVRDKDQLGKNVPSGGYHIWTTGLL